MVTEPATAFPVKLNVNDVALLKVIELKVNPVVPVATLNIELTVGVSKSAPVIVIVGFDAPFAMVLLVEMLGAPAENEVPAT